MYISQLIRYSRACSDYHDFLHRCAVLTERLLKQGYVRPRLVKALKKFYGRHHELVKRYDVSVCQLTNDIFSSMSIGDVYTFWLTYLRPSGTHFMPLHWFDIMLASITPTLTLRNFMTGATCGAGNAYPSGAPDFTSGFLKRFMLFPVYYTFP